MTSPAPEVLAIGNPEACGMGEGARCCAFLAADQRGWICGRTMVGFPELIRKRLAEGTMNAQYDPGDELPFPECQKQR